MSFIIVISPKKSLKKLQKCATLRPTKELQALKVENKSIKLYSYRSAMMTP